MSLTLLPAPEPVAELDLETLETLASRARRGFAILSRSVQRWTESTGPDQSFAFIAFQSLKTEAGVFRDLGFDAEPILEQLESVKDRVKILTPMK